MSDHVGQQPWRPKSYPVQSCDHIPGSSADLSPETEEEVRQLPQAIRATQTSGSEYSGGRTLVICLDGTGDQFDADNSNVVNFVACLKKDDHSQLTYYQSGIGTYDGHGLKNGISAGIDMAVGSGLGIHIKDAYRFLMQNYREGDKICLFGFSRGSYTVRCLAGMLHKVGLLPAHNPTQISFAYNFYKNDTPEGWKMSEEFKKTFCTDVPVYFVGVWDCVASVGFIPRKLPFSKSPTNTFNYFRHAMALDEHRSKFKVCQWQGQDREVQAKTTIDKTPKTRAKAEKNAAVGRIRRMFSSRSGSQPKAEEPETAKADMSSATSATSTTSFTSHLKAHNSIKKLETEIKKIDVKKPDQTKLESEFEKEDHSMHEHVSTDVLEVWFTGAHADVGGGAVLNAERHMLSRIPLRWMIRQCFECNTGILFGTAALAETGIDIMTVWPVYKKPTKPVVGPSPNTVEKYEAGGLPPIQRRSTALGVDRDSIRKAENKPKEVIRTPRSNDVEKKHQVNIDLLPEQVEDHFDAMAPINDQLVLDKKWWILEFWPVKVRIQKDDSDEWEKVVRMNLGRYRCIQQSDPHMHWTVQLRMNDKGYKIRNRVDRNSVWQLAT